MVDALVRGDQRQSEQEPSAYTIQRSIETGQKKGRQTKRESAHRSIIDLNASQIKME